MGRRAQLGLVGTIAGSLVATILVVPAAAAEEDRSSWSLEQRIEHGQDLLPPVDESDLVPSEPAPAPDDSQPAREREQSEGYGDQWPEAGVSELDLSSAGADSMVTPGGLPVQVQAAETSPMGGDLQSPVRVEVADQQTATAAGIDGVLLSVEPLTEGEIAEGGEVEVEVDYSGFAGAYGGDWASRLRLVSLPSCDLNAPDATQCNDLIDLGSLNDTQDGTLTARVAPAQAGVLAVAAASSGSGGDWSATPLPASASWSAGGSSGAFSWSYPMRTVPSPGGLDPDLALSYSSASLDGRVASTNNQSSWVGDGWDMWSGYIERKYVACTDDREGGANNATHKTGDLCWKSDNATLVFNDMSTDLVKDVATGVWRAKNDDGTRVEHLTGAWNSDNDKEYWKFTTPNGTQYFFGRDKRSATDTLALNSAWTVPVFGNHPGEPCYQAAFASSSCTQAWRWNLDYVVDTSGNTLTYTYAKETNNYGHNLNTGVSSYVRGGYLTSILYGTRVGDEAGDAPMRVDFTVAERCTPAGAITCDPAQLTDANAASWPDVPFDLICTSATSCPTQFSPAFFTRKRLATVTTKVLSGSTYRSVDSWTLGHQLPDPGDGQDAVLWLASVTHKGLAGTAITLPATTFVGTQMANRVDKIGDLGPPMNRYRLQTIKSESGAWTTVNYTAQDCTTASLPASPQANTRRCFPVYWTPEGATEPVMEYFHKYLVASVVDDGRVAGSQAAETSYSYVGAPAWHYDDNELVPVKQRTWGQYRGYATVDVTTGATTSTQLKSRYRYFRGMNGDRLAPTGGTRAVSVDGITDDDRFAGMVREQITYDGASEVEGTLSTPWRSPATATGADGATAHFAGISTNETRTTAPAAPGGVRTTRQITTFDDQYGSPVQIDDQGDTATVADDKCTRLEYVRNVAMNITGTIKRTETVAKACTTAPTRPGDVIADSRVLYDGGAYGAAPTRGLVSETQQVKSFTGATPVYLTTAKSTFDTLGRVLSVSDALGRTSTTAYTPAVGGPVTKTTTTSPDPDGTGVLSAHVTTSELDPAWGSPVKATDANGKVTTGTYDALGRLTQVWLPGRVQVTDTPNTKYAYTVSATGTNTVTTSTLSHDATYLTSVAIYDGLLRARQSQMPSRSIETGGRLITDTLYDTRGLVESTNAPWQTTGTPGTTIVAPTTAVPARTLTTYDGAARPVREVFQVNNQDKWATTTTYGGDRVTVVPPTGGTPTTTITDARGQVTELRQYTTASVTGPFQTTTYTRDTSDRLAVVTDAARNTWTYTYDLLGRQIATSDPDKGASTSTYDDAGQVLTSTDARGVTVATKYDLLGRKTETREGSLTGALRAKWTYDTLAKGQVTNSIRYDAGNAYTNAVTAFDDGYRPLGQSITLPVAEGALAGTYTTNYTYTLDGKLDTYTNPAIGGLAAETVYTDYNALGLPQGMGGGGGRGVYVANARYSSYGEPLLYDLGNTYSEQLAYTYEAGTRRLTNTSLVRELMPGTALNLTYTRDPAGNVTSIKDAPTGKPADAQCFAYDGLARMTEAWTPSTANCATTRTAAGLGGVAPYWTSYTFDQVGNRTTSTQHTTAGDAKSTYTYPAAGAARPHTVTKVATAGTTTATNTYAYDAAGNTTTRAIAGKPAQTLSWDAEGKLDTVTENATVTDDYLYDTDGNRLLRRQDGQTTAYLTGGIELTLTTATKKVTATKYYSFNGKTIAIRTGLLLAGVKTLISDHHATAQITLENTGARTLTRRYQDPYGNPRGTNPTWTGDHGFLDKPTDTTGLTQIGARYYDPQIGRFSSVDPVMDLTDPQQWNGYAYSNSNPITYADPSGLIYCGSSTCPETYEYNPTTGIGTVHKPQMGISTPRVINKKQNDAYLAAQERARPAMQRAMKKYVRVALDFVSAMPVVGAPADVASTIWYAMDGDWENAGWGVIGGVPLLGDAAKLGFRAPGAIADASRAAEEAEEAAGAISIYRTPKITDAAHELANGPNPLNHQIGDASAYFGEFSVARDYIGMPGYAGGVVKYDMHPSFLDEFEGNAHRYDWQGPGGSARVEWAIPADRLGAFGDLTLSRTWVEGK